jgi:hypothetical protein
MQDISKNSLVFRTNFNKVNKIMESLGFWLPLVFLFLSALFGTALKRRARDHCLKKLDRNKVILPYGAEDWQRGEVRIFAQGIELLYTEPQKQPFGKVNSLVIHPHEVEKIPFIIRPAPKEDTRAGVKWSKELFLIRNPSFTDKVFRVILNFYNMLRDAFGQAAQTIIGAMSKDSSVSKVKNADKRMNEIGSGLTELVPNAWEPILEKYRGQAIVVERKTSEGMVKEAGVLEDYSSKYLLVRQVAFKDSKIAKFVDGQGGGPKLYDVLYSRATTIIRNTLID